MGKELVKGAMTGPVLKEELLVWKEGMCGSPQGCFETDLILSFH